MSHEKEAPGETKDTLGEYLPFFFIYYLTRSYGLSLIILCFHDFRVFCSSNNSNVEYVRVSATFR